VLEKLKLERPEHKTLKETVVVSLRKAILYGDIKPGEQLKQEQIAKHLGISRMPVREALSQLESEGLIQNIPYKGCVVNRFTSEDIREIYQIRKVLESYANELAAKNMTDEDIERLEALMAKMKACVEAHDIESYASFDREFHQAIFENSQNKRLKQIIVTIWKSFPLYLAYSIPRRIQRSFDEQSRIVEAIRRHDPKGAARLARVQIETVYKEMVPHFQKFSVVEGQHLK
jgi:DNA-binding GntR family transcriptional regulator